MTARRPGVVLALVAAAAAPAQAAWLKGYARTVAGAELTYHSPYPDITSALITRASDGTMAVEWQTEPLPADWKGGPATFIFLAGHATGKGGHRFDLVVEGREKLSFRTSADSSRREWRETGSGGLALEFKSVMVDQFDELFGFMWLEVPASLLQPGRPVTIRVTGEAAGSNDWFMVFRDDLRRDVWARGEQALVRKEGRLFQIVRVEMSHLAPPAGALVSCGGEKARLELKLGWNGLEFLIPAVEHTGRVTIEVALDDGSVRRGELEVKPVVPREIWLLPHSHVDIGFSDPQPVVEKNQWRHNLEAIALGAKSAGHPAGARFKWNIEQAWALETYWRQASGSERAAVIEAIRGGTFGLQATLAGVLTGLCHPEELFHLTRFARDLGRLAGRPVDSIMVTDIPSQSWSLVPALALAGIKYVSSGPNYMPSLFDGGDRVGWALKTWGDKPFYWLSPSGAERVLFWMAGRGYSWFHGLNMGSLAKAPAEKILEYMNELAEKGYPYGMVQVRYTVGGDNGPPDPELAGLVERWNEKYASPRMVIATASEMFAEFERRYGASLPVVRGDFTGYWEDGAASTARETAAARVAADRLVQAEALWSILGRPRFPSEKDDEAWRQVVLFSEHTWGASDSVSDPDGEGPRAQWEYKKAFAVEAERRSRELLEGALDGRNVSAAGAGHGQGAAIDVVNTLSWPRTDLVTVPAVMSGGGDLVRDDRGTAVPSQRLRSGELAFLATDVPGLGVRRYVIGPGRAPAEGSARAGRDELDSRRIKAAVDRATGAVKSLVSKDGPGRELVETGAAAGPGLAHYLYVPGLDPRTAQAPSGIKIRPGEAGPLVASLVVESDAPGTRGLRREYRVVDGLPRLEMAVTIDKERVRAKEGVHIAFPFAMARAVVRVDAGWGFVRPEADQLPGACRDYFCARDSTDISNPDYGLTWTSLDAPLVEIGAMTDETPRNGERRAWRRTLEPSTRLFSYAMNNYWHTNYKADQEGPVTLRYVAALHEGADTAAAKRLGLEASNPLVPMPAETAGPPPRFAVVVESPGFVATRLKPAAAGKAWVLRLFNASSEARKLVLSGEACDEKRVYLGDLDERLLAPMSSPLEVPAYGIVTLLIRVLLDDTRLYIPPYPRGPARAKGG